MAQPVWVLSVDLQTKTATFQSGMAEAAKSARGAFTEIKSGSEEMGARVGGNMMEARHGVMLLGEEFGIHLPRALTTFIASIGPVGAAMEAAFPFLAIAVGATLLIEHLAKIHEAGEKLTDDQVHFGTAVQNAFNQLDQKILQAQIRADDLKNNHLGALSKELELIDQQSMAELVHSFEEVAKAADVVFGDLKTQFYNFGIGSAGAKHALDQFKTQYDSLLAQGKQDEAGGLLSGTLKRAQQILDAQNTLTRNRYSAGNDGKPQGGDPMKERAAEVELRKLGVGFTEKEVTAQAALVEALTAQVGVQERIGELKKLDASNAKTGAGNAAAAQNATMARNAAESMLRMGESAIAADKAQAEARMTIARASVEERIQSEIDFANREFAVKEAANAQETAALDRSSRDYTTQLKALNDKATELTQEHATQIAEIQSRGEIEAAQKALEALQQGEREKIEATRQGSSERLAAITDAIREEESRNLQDTSFYKELLTQRVEATRQAAEEQARLAEAAGKEAADNAQKAGELTLAAEKANFALINSARITTDAQRAAQDEKIANEEYAMKTAALAREITALDQNGKDYETKLKALQDKEKQLVQEHENAITAIKEKAEEERNSRILSAEQRFNDTISRGLTEVIMGHETFAKMVTSLGNQVVTGMIENAVKSMLADDMTKEKDAAAAARKAFNIGLSMGGPAGWVLGPVMGAAAFASVMAFEMGTDRVPGVGNRDIVPAMLTPGEGVVPGGVMDNLSKMAREGRLTGGGHTYHVHLHPTYHVNTIDGDGMQDVLDKHTDVLQKKFESVVRRMNR